jgi:hypothetical protein
VHIASPSVELGGLSGTIDLFVVTGTGGGGESEFGGGGSGVPDAVVGPALNNQHRGFVDRTAPRVALTAWMTLAFAVFGASTT